MSRGRVMGQCPSQGVIKAPGMAWKQSDISIKKSFIKQRPRIKRPAIKVPELFSVKYTML